MTPSNVWALMRDSITQKSREGKAERYEEHQQLDGKNNHFDYAHLREFI
jgi:hypothetical protein